MVEAVKKHWWVCVWTVPVNASIGDDALLYSVEAPDKASAIRTANDMAIADGWNIDPSETTASETRPIVETT